MIGGASRAAHLDGAAVGGTDVRNHQQGQPRTADVQAVSPQQPRNGVDWNARAVVLDVDSQVESIGSKHVWTRMVPPWARGDPARTYRSALPTSVVTAHAIFS